MMNPHRFVCGLIIWLGLAGFLPIAHAVDLAISHLAASSPSGTINPSASGSLPNLTPFRPSGWTDKIVVRNGAGQVKPDIFSTSDTLFLEWAVINYGGTDVKSSYAIDLYVDGVKKKTWEDNDLPTGYYLYSINAYSLASLSAGASLALAPAPTRCWASHGCGRSTRFQCYS